MPIKKLVELDGEFGGWLEVDPVKLVRAATAFKEWLMAVDPSNDPFDFLHKDLPIVEGVIGGFIKPPNDLFPHNWEIREGLLPREYTAHCGTFLQHASWCSKRPSRGDHKRWSLLRVDGV